MADKKDLEPGDNVIAIKDLDRGGWSPGVPKGTMGVVTKRDFGVWNGDVLYVTFENGKRLKLYVNDHDVSLA